MRAAVLKVGASLLEGLLGADTGHRGTRIDCGAGHQAVFVSYRSKTFDTVLGPIRLLRAYYHCPDCNAGVIPRDDELGMASASLSPGLRAMLARLGAGEAFAKAADLLSELAGVEVSAKAVERSAEADGAVVATRIAAEAKALIAGSMSQLGNGAAVDKLYVTLDGTGVPAIPAETQDRTGKGTDGRARTREVKLACCFTQSSLDAEGRPVRDPGSSSYAATFAPAASFGELAYAEARRRGLQQAASVIVIGDGAPWIWNIAGMHFPNAVEIVDLYHAREHLHDLGNLVAPVLDAEPRGWIADRLADLDRGDVEALIGATRALELPAGLTTEADKALGYFETNTERMRYATFRARGLFVGSGAVEAGCRAVIAQRLKRSGMRWSVRGASGIVALRCEEASGRWDQIWQQGHTQTSVA